MSTALTVASETRLPPSKHCMRCGGVFPCTTEYWQALDKRGEPVGAVCRVCKTPAMQAQYEIERLKKENFRRAVAELAAAAKNNEYDCPDSTASTALVIAQFGGIEEFARYYVDLIKDEKATHRQRLEACQFIFRMIGASNQQAYRDASAMSDEELADWMERYLENRKLTIAIPHEDANVPAPA